MKHEYFKEYFEESHLKVEKIEYEKDVFVDLKDCRKYTLGDWRKLVLKEVNLINSAANENTYSIDDKGELVENKSLEEDVEVSGIEVKTKIKTE